jgi:small subunit ribosomal protein S8
MTDETTQPSTAPSTAPAAAEGDRPGERTAPVAKRVPSTRKPRPRVVGVPNDPVADLLTRVRNAAGARHESVSIPTSRTKVEIAKILKAEGFISNFEQPSGKELVIKMKYVGGKIPAVSGLRRISKPGLRVYARKTEMPRVLGGLGIAIVSTSSGVMTGREAERKGLGGEVLAYIW